MGKAIILTNSNFTANNLGVVHRISASILPEVVRITTATIFRVVKGGIQVPSVNWSIDDSTLATLVNNGDGTCTLTPKIITLSPVLLTAEFGGETLFTSILATREYIDITASLSSSFVPRKAIGQFSATYASANTKRCCIPATLFSALNIDVQEYSEIQLTIKNGYDYVFATGPVPGNATDWQGWNGSTGTQEFAWVTDNQKAIATIDSTVLAMSLNLRYDDNTTEFPATTHLADIVDSILLVK